MPKMVRGVYHDGAISLLEKEKSLTNIVSLPVEKLLSCFEWMRHFDSVEKAEFLLELFSTVKDAEEHSDWEQVTELLDEWRETANINADTYVVEAIEQAKKEFTDGEGISWNNLRRELDL